MPGACAPSDNVVAEVQAGAEAISRRCKEFFFDDDTFNIRKDRVLEVCEKFKPLGFRWSCHGAPHSDYETLKAMADAGARLFIVGFESGDAQILKNIKKGATVEMARAFVKNCKKVGIKVHGDFIIGLPGETKKPSRRPSIMPRSWTAKRFRFPLPTPSRARSFTTMTRRTISWSIARSLMTAATSFRISNTRARPSRDDGGGEPFL